MDRQPSTALPTLTEITAMVDGFYERVRGDADLGPVFAKRIAPDAWPSHLGRMRDFWSTILLGSSGYRGNPLLIHRLIPGLERAHFTRWLELFEQVVAELFSAPVGAGIVQRARRMGATLQADLPH